MRPRKLVNIECSCSCSLVHVHVHEMFMIKVMNISETPNPERFVSLSGRRYLGTLLFHGESCESIRMLDCETRGCQSELRISDRQSLHVHKDLHSTEVYLRPDFSFSQLLAFEVSLSRSRSRSRLIIAYPNRVIHPLVVFSSS